MAAKKLSKAYIKRRLTIIGRKLRASYYFWVMINAVLRFFQKDIIKKRCLQNLLIAKSCLDKLRIQYWITDGTLLGFYREGDFISGDPDVDIGVYIDDWTPAILNTFKKNGLRLLRLNGQKEAGLEYTFTRRGVNLDIFFFYREQDYVWHATWLGNEMIRYKFPPFGLREDVFLGHSFSIPENTEEYLRLKYGAGWRTPVSNWNWATDPENIF